MAKRALITYMAVLVSAVSLFATALPALAQEELTESFVSNDGSLTFELPTGWYAEEFMLPGIIFAGTSEVAVSLFMENGTGLAPGDLGLGIIGPQATGMFFEGAAPTTLDEAMAILMQTDEEGNDTEFGEPEAMILNDFNALLVTAVDSISEGVGIVIDIDGAYALVTAVASPGEYDQFADTVLAIADTINYEVPEGLLTYESSGISFDYPAEWVTLEVFDGSYMIMNTMMFEETPAQGQIILSMTTPAALAMYGLPTESEAGTVASEFASVFTIEQGEKELGELEDVTIGMYEGVQIAFTGETSEGFVVALSMDDGPLVIVVNASTDELADFEADVMAIIESIVYTPAE